MCSFFQLSFGLVLDSSGVLMLMGEVLSYLLMQTLKKYCLHSYAIIRLCPQTRQDRIKILYVSPFLFLLVSRVN